MSESTTLDRSSQTGAGVVVHEDEFSVSTMQNDDTIFFLDTWS